ncbi:MAG: hypothetical protein Q4D16_07760 [Eubacteriales bacterium]|nr:hypothetical protein [Eubacteriales bacterium]
MALFSKKTNLKPMCLRDNKWVISVFGILMAGASCISFQYAMMSQEKIPFFYDIILDQTNGLLDICLIIPFAWLLVTGNPKSLFYGQSFKTIIVIKNVFAINAICLFCFYVMNLIIYLWFSGFKNPFINYWTANNQMYRMGFGPINACLVSLLLLYIRMTFFTLVSLVINMMFNSEIYGFVGVLTLCLIDWGVYEWLKIYKPTGLLLVEHSRILYTTGYAPMIRTDVRISFGFTIFYWVSLYVVMIYLFIRFRGKNVEVLQNE